jgi:hypothetical protein
MESLEVRAASQLEDAEETLVAGAQRVSHELQNAVRDREFRQALRIVVRIFADEEDRSLIGGE